MIKIISEKLIRAVIAYRSSGGDVKRCLCNACGPHLLSHRVCHALDSEHESLRIDETDEREITSSSVENELQIDRSADFGKDCKSSTSIVNYIRLSLG